MVGPDYPAGYPVFGRKNWISGNFRQGMPDNPASGKKNQIRPNFGLDNTTDESVQEEPESLDDTRVRGIRQY